MWDWDCLRSSGRTSTPRTALAFEELAKAGFEGSEYQAFCDDLWDYGMKVLNAGLRTGDIFQWCWEADIVIKPTSDERRVLHSSAADRDELVVDTILSAIPWFRQEVLLKKRWSPNRGASLRTFFIGTCKHHFRIVFRRWQRERFCRLAAYGYGIDPVLVAGALVDTLATDPEEYVAAADLVTRLLTRATPEAKMACYLLLQDFTLAEIGERLGITERAVEGHLHRLRKHARTMVKQGRIEVPEFLETKRLAGSAA